MGATGYPRDMPPIHNLAMPNDIPPRRLGIFGGSFDPVHFGHLLLAESCREACQLDQVWLLPAAVPPHKQQRTLSAPAKRVAMLELALAGNPALRVSTLELDRGGISYTVDTLVTIRQQLPDTELFLLLGADSLVDLPNWRSPARICALATPVVVRRAGTPEPKIDTLSTLVDAQRQTQLRVVQVEMPVIGLSSTTIRHRVAHGQSIRFRTPRAVEKYIETHGLYTAGSS